MDVGAWVKQRLVDIVCPSDFFYTDFNTPVEDFVQLTQGTNCQVYPSVHPPISWGNDRGLMTAENYTAAAKNFYAAGAAGVSPYNYQYHWTGLVRPDHAERTLWPAALDLLTPLRDPDAIAAHDRHYLYHPLWADADGGHCPTGAYKNDRILLDCSKVNPQGSFRFKLAEDLTDPNLSAVLEFKANRMIAGEQLEIQITGQQISPRQVEAEWRAGQNLQGREPGRQLAGHYFYRIPLAAGLIVFGDNELTARLVQRVGLTARMISVEEVEVRVSVK